MAADLVLYFLLSLLLSLSLSLYFYLYLYKKIITILQVHKAVESLENNAKTRGHLAGCNAIFLETNSAEKVSAADDVMDPNIRHRVFDWYVLA